MSRDFDGLSEDWIYSRIGQFKSHVRRQNIIKSISCLLPKYLSEHPCFPVSAPGEFVISKQAVAQTASQSTSEEPSGESFLIPLTACASRKKLSTSSLGSFAQQPEKV